MQSSSSAGGGEAPAEEAPAEGEGEGTAQLSWPAVKIFAPKWPPGQLVRVRSQSNWRDGSQQAVATGTLQQRL